MAYDFYDGTLPDGATQKIAVLPWSVRKNYRALCDALNSGGAYKGLDMNVDPANPETPDWILYGVGQAEQLRLTITWTADDNPQTILYERSTNSGGNWDTIGTKTISYDTEGFVTGHAWS